MSKGTKVYSLRIPENLVLAMKEQIESINYHTKGEIVEFGPFILKAIREKMAHMERSRRKNRKKVTTPKQEPIPHGSVIHPIDGKPFDWESMYRNMEIAEREAIDGTD